MTVIGKRDYSKPVRWTDQRIVPRALIGPHGRVHRHCEAGTLTMSYWYTKGPHDCRYGVFTDISDRVFVVDFFKAQMEEQRFTLIIKEVMEYPDVDTAIMATIMGYDMGLMPSELSMAVSRGMIWIDELPQDTTYNHKDN